MRVFQEKVFGCCLKLDSLFNGIFFYVWNPSNLLAYVYYMYKICTLIS